MEISNKARAFAFTAMAAGFMMMAAGVAGAADQGAGVDDGTHLSLWTRAATQARAEALVKAYNAGHKNQIGRAVHQPAPEIVRDGVLAICRPGGRKGEIGPVGISIRKRQQVETPPHRRQRPKIIEGPCCRLARPAIEPGQQDNRGRRPIIRRQQNHIDCPAGWREAGGQREKYCWKHAIRA